MLRARRDPEEESARGQLFLFSVDAEKEATAPEAGTPPEEAEPALPDLKEEFDRLNRRFFGGHLAAALSWSNRLVASAGSCNHTRREIRISVPHHRRRPDLLPVTLTHEMCHLVFPDHGPSFRKLGKSLARELGVTWREFRYSEAWADMKRYAYVYACPACGRERPSRKRLRASCGHCGRGGYREEFRLVLTESRARPGPVLLGERPARTRPPTDSSSA